MRILIKNCTLISVDSNREKIEENMDILIVDDLISKIGKNINVSVDKIIDASGKVVMPGLINSHSHVGMSVFRETLDGYTLQDWLSKKIWPIEDNFTETDMYYASYLTFLEMIRTGTTTANDMYFITESIVKAMIDSGVRLQTTRCFMDTAGYENGIARFDELDDVINRYKNDRLTFNCGLHSFYTASPKYVDDCINYADKNNMIIHTHFCENSNELNDILKLQGDLPMKVLKNKIGNRKAILAHCVKLDEKDIDELAKMNITVAHCPISNLKLGCGITKIDYMLQKGINVALGTDGQGSGCSMDMFESMKYASLLQKGIMEDPTKLNAYEVIKMATINGAKALGLDNEIGSITVGKKADIIIIDMDSIITKPINNLISEIVYNVKGNDVCTTIINGKILMENKKFKTRKVNKIINECNSIFDRISIIK